MSSLKESLDIMSIDGKSQSTGSDDRNNNNSNSSSSNHLLTKKKFKDDLTGEWHCPVCDTKCDSQHSFTVHIRQHNPTDHSHTCSICGKTLSSASSLDRHMLIHSGERPFKCKICNMAFTTNGNMHRHMRTHGMESNENDAPDSNNNKNHSRANSPSSVSSLNLSIISKTNNSNNNNSNNNNNSINHKMKGRKRKITTTDDLTTSFSDCLSPMASPRLNLATSSSSPSSVSSPKTKVYSENETNNNNTISNGLPLILTSSSPSSAVQYSSKSKSFSGAKVNSNRTINSHGPFTLTDRSSLSSSFSSSLSTLSTGEGSPADKFNLTPSSFAVASAAGTTPNQSQVDSIACNLCGLSLPNYASLSSHTCMNNRKSGSKSGRNSILDNSGSAIGFHDLTFTDFSSRKYPLIAKSFCESNIRKSSSPYHDFECTKCFKAFPCAAALTLHQKTSHAEATNDTNNSSESSSPTYCHICQIDLGSPVVYLSHQAKHRYESFLSTVNGVNLSSNSSSLFPKPFDVSSLTAAVAAASAAKALGSEGHSSSANDNEKEQFLALLQLHNRKYLVKDQIDALKNEEDEETGFDYPSYFINAKPSLLKGTNGLVHTKSNQRSIEKKNHTSEKTKDKLPNKQGLTDTSSIISVTSSSVPLNGSNNNLTSSPPSATPASPIEAEIGSGREAGSAASPVSASAHPLNGQALSPKDQAATNSVAEKDQLSEFDDGDSSDDGDKAMEIDDTKKCSSESGSTEKENSGEQDELKISDDASDVSGQMYKCEICSLVFKTFNALKRHNRGHTKGGHNYVCNLCPYTSLDKSTLVRHLRTHNGERPFQCAICKYAFTTKANCERHVRKRHKKLSKHEIKNAMQFNAALTTSSSSSAASHLTIQNISRHNSLPSIIGLEWPGPNDTLCRYCNLDLKNNKVLRHHIRTLHANLSNKPYSCTLCKMGFSTKNNCIRHVMRLHPEMKEDLTSVVLVNGSSAPSRSGSDDISESELGTIADASSIGGTSITTTSQHNNFHNNSNISANNNKDHSTLNLEVHGSPTTSHLNNNAALPTSKSDISSVDAFTFAWQFHSSLAALCQIAGAVSPIASGATDTTGNSGGPNDKSLHLASLVSGGEGYDGDESNGGDYQPIDLSKNSDGDGEDKKKKKLDDSSKVGLRHLANFYRHHHNLKGAHGEQPLDLAAHALDLSCKPSKQETHSSHNQSLVELNKCSEPIRTAASSLLALQSFVPSSPNNSMLISHCLSLNSNSSASSPLARSQHSASSSFLATANNGGLPISASNSLLNGTSLTAENSASSIVNINGRYLSGLNGPKASLLTKHSRNFTCCYCSAGFTLKSNMERHIKRKHPEYARSSRPGRASSVGLTPNGQQQSTTNNNSSDPETRSVSLLYSPGNPNKTLSNKTRAALRVVLNNKALGNQSVESNDSALAINGKDETESSPNGNSEEPGGDLASVSSMIDNTANSSHTLRHYFDKATEESMSSVNNENKESLTNAKQQNGTTNPSGSASSSEDNNDQQQQSQEQHQQSIRPKSKQEVILGDKKKSSKNNSIHGNGGGSHSPQSGDQNVVPKKRSAYTDSPNSVSCPYCSRRFPWTSSLRRHILTHTGLKPYKCPKCPILFTTKSNCERHLVRKHNNNKQNLETGSSAEIAVPKDNKQYKCNFCPGTYFSTQGNLRKHYYLRHWTKTGSKNRGKGIAD